MEIKTTKNLPPLVKQSSTYKIIIPDKVERMIRFLCEKVWNTEWSGVLFYTPTGTFEDDNLEIHCVDILPMDIGSTTYTEFAMSPDVISYMAQKPELLDCKMGLIHSHNNMSTFFSGTDTATLQEEGNERNHFVSLIVNNEGKYTAAITRKVEYTTVVKSISYEGFSGKVNLEEEEEYNDKEIEYFYLNVQIENPNDEVFTELSSRIDEIKKKKPQTSTFSPNTTYGYSYPTKTAPVVEKPAVIQPTLFDDSDWDFPQKKNQTQKEVVNDWGNYWDKKLTPKTNKSNELVSKEDIEKIMNQLLTGSVTITKVDKDTKEKLIKTIDKRFSARFGDVPEGLAMFKYWATDFMEFLLWYSVDDPDADECFVTTEIADKVTDELSKLPSSPFIDIYIDLLSHYASTVY